ncbi:hypothetical protein GCM10010435_37570 [Winogradskya consettensis]|uniref:Uncharacterized protein n=1 Tax=Winogradskya consettensis TaxID=113560 RepID=A0A919T3Y9_9ACTN|nr:hypothetical protein [Actinoplanes consettensis]GIM83844.1 hypothetical protein Aco04nite_88520 [Actinoplanes consettensis]
MKTHRRTVALLAGPALRTAREVYTTVPSDTVRVAALVEIAAGAAALARTLVKLRHLDPDLIAPHVSYPEDLRAVLGRGRWLPTMIRSVPEPPEGEPPAILPARSVRRRVQRRGHSSGQGALFPLREVS